MPKSPSTPLVLVPSYTHTHTHYSITKKCCWIAILNKWKLKLTLSFSDSHRSWEAPRAPQSVTVSAGVTSASQAVTGSSGCGFPPRLAKGINISFPVNFLTRIPSSFISLSSKTPNTHTVSIAHPQMMRGLTSSNKDNGFKSCGRTEWACRLLKAPLIALLCTPYALCPQSCKRKDHF